jgi:hypothetical protein
MARLCPWNWGRYLDLQRQSPPRLGDGLIAPRLCRLETSSRIASLETLAFLCLATGKHETRHVSSANTAFEDIDHIGCFWDKWKIYGAYTRTRSSGFGFVLFKSIFWYFVFSWGLAKSINGKGGEGLEFQFDFPWRVDGPIEWSLQASWNRMVDSICLV